MTHAERWLFVGLALSALVVHAPLLGNDWVFDDIPAVVENPVIASGGPREILTSDYWGGRRNYSHVTTYRPVTSATFRAERLLFGLNPVASHAINVLLHALAVVLVAALVLAWGGSRTLALAAGAWFSVHPIHVEAIASVVNRAELLAFVFAVATLLAWRKGRAAWAVLFFGLGIFSKENAVTVLPLLTLDAWFAAGRHPSTLLYRGRRTALKIAPFVGLLLAMLLARAAVLPAMLGGAIPVLDNPMVNAGWPSRALTPFKVLTHAVAKLFFPVQLSPDYSAYAIAPATWTDRDAWTGIALSLGAVAAAWRLRARVPALGLGVLLFAVTWSVTSNIPFLSTILYADRGMYLPSLGVAVMVGAVVAELRERPETGTGHKHGTRAPRPWPLALVFGVYLAGFAILSVMLGQAWRSNRSLFEHAVSVTPDSARAQGNLGHELMGAGEVEAAERHLRRAIRLEPQSFVARSNLGALLVKQGRLREAERSLLHTLLLAPGYAQAWVNLAQARLQGRRPRGSLEASARAITIAPDLWLAWEIQGAAQLAMKDLRPGVASLLRSLRSGHPNPGAVLQNLARLGRQTGTSAAIREELRGDERRVFDETP
jgi:protein O-mannosyl-transferase